MSAEERPLALLSVWNKEGIVEFARGLAALGFELVSTGGTHKVLSEAGLAVTPVSDLTGFPEILGGRVKSLHPRVHGGILARRDARADRADMDRLGLRPVDVVAVNLYPFPEVAARPGVSLAEAIEHIDIGGPAMVRAAAKNHAHVVVVVNPARYGEVLAGLRRGNGGLAPAQRLELAREAFALTAAYDRAVAGYLEAAAGGRPWRGPAADLPAARPDPAGPPAAFPARLCLDFELQQVLRYGENPHQAAAFYAQAEPPLQSLPRARQLQGKELSFNNLLDAGAALALAREFSEPAAVAVKHQNPCGAAVAASVAQAFRLARDADPVSIFGGIVACNRPVDGEAAREMAKLFLEVVVAPGFSPEARAVLARRENLRLLELGGPGARLLPAGPGWDLRAVPGGLLVQETDVYDPDPGLLRVVTRRAPAPEEWEDLRFAWRVVKHVRSNGIVVARGRAVLGVGAGQMNRILPARLALAQAGEAARGAVLASEAFFPFPDVVEAAAAAGIRAIIQPGGARRDADSVAKADEAGIAMVFTGVRHFRH